MPSVLELVPKYNSDAKFRELLWLWNTIKIARIAYPKLIAEQIVNIQPMDKDAGMIYTAEYDSNYRDIFSVPDDYAPYVAVWDDVRVGSAGILRRNSDLVSFNFFYTCCVAYHNLSLYDCKTHEKVETIPVGNDIETKYTILYIYRRKKCQLIF
jgi:hypothetical protein